MEGGETGNSGSPGSPKPTTEPPVALDPQEFSFSFADFPTDCPGQTSSGASVWNGFSDTSTFTFPGPSPVSAPLAAEGVSDVKVDFSLPSGADPPDHKSSSVYWGHDISVTTEISFRENSTISDLTLSNGAEGTEVKSEQQFSFPSDFAVNTKSTEPVKMGNAALFEEGPLTAPYDQVSGDSEFPSGFSCPKKEEESPSKLGGGLFADSSSSDSSSPNRDECGDTPEPSTEDKTRGQFAFPTDFSVPKKDEEFSKSNTFNEESGDTISLQDHEETTVNSSSNPAFIFPSNFFLGTTHMMPTSSFTNIIIASYCHIILHKL
jgi:hypothetical protein